jgi:hypothetical protein
MTHESAFELLVLHAVRITGFAGTPVLARRYGLDPAATEEALRDFEAYGWVQHTSFAGDGGWSLTERGRAENERRLAAELDATGAADQIRDVYQEFLPLNALLLRACTDWQLKPAGGGRLTTNDHADTAWDAGVLHELSSIGRALTQLAGRLTAVLSRFSGYDRRYATALTRAKAGEPAWVDSIEVDSCHRVWFELHEDLIATLGVERATGSGRAGGRP